MAILFVGNSPEDFNSPWTESTATASTARDPLYSPSSTLIVNTSDNTNSAYINLPADPSGDLWFHCRMFVGVGLTGTTPDGHLLSFYSANGTLLARLDFLDSFVRAQVNGDTSVLGANFNIASSTLHNLDIRVSGGANITMEVYLNGGLASTATAANTLAKGLTRQIALEFDDVVSLSNSQWFLSEVIVTDGGESTIGWRLATLTPTSAGAHSQWGNDFQSILSGFDGRFITSATANEKESWVHSAYLGPSSVTSVRAVVEKINATKGAAGPQNIVPFLRIGGTDYERPAVTPDVRYQILGVWDTNPATGAAWNTSALAALEAGVRSAT